MWFAKMIGFFNRPNAVVIFLNQLEGFFKKNQEHRRHHGVNIKLYHNSYRPTSIAYIKIIKI